MVGMRTNTIARERLDLSKKAHTTATTGCATEAPGANCHQGLQIQQLQGTMWKNVGRCNSSREQWGSDREH
jgi:hypothetical protein